MKNSFLLSLLYMLCCGLPVVSTAQSSCLVTHYNRKEYNAGSQNWSVDIDRQGFVYAANNDGLMKYDGVRWKLYPMPSRTIARSVSVSADGRIYTGSNEEFGYWEKDPETGLNGLNPKS